MRKCAFKINISLEEAKKRYCNWLNEDVEFKLDEYGNYVHQSVYVSQFEEGWTYFEDLAGEEFFGLSNQSWMKMAKNNCLTYVYYDEDFNAELIVIEDSMLIREFLLYEDETDNNVDFGSSVLLEGWDDVATFFEKELTI
ncbi:hypothetical protein ABET51_11190 [Metabacillus fastidiosus]|uniref:hypothetical protein n=1 Tax=Metabacillus fastidiosus TaxID=1458 RepID=UPI003D28F23A